MACRSSSRNTRLRLVAFANYVRSAKQQVAKVIRFAATRRLQLLTCRSSSRNTPLRSVVFGGEPPWASVWGMRVRLFSFPFREIATSLSFLAMTVAKYRSAWILYRYSSLRRFALAYCAHKIDGEIYFWLDPSRYLCYNRSNIIIIDQRQIYNTRTAIKLKGA